MTKSRRSKRSTTQTLLWLLSLFLVLSMIISLIVVVIPGATRPVEPTATATPIAPTATATLPLLPTEMTPAMGPDLPTATPIR